MQSAVIWTSLDIRHVTESSHDATVTRHPARLKTSTMTVVSISSDPFAIGTSAVFGFGVVVVVVVGSDDDDDIIIIVFVRAHRFPDDDDFKDDEKTPLPTRTTKRFPPPPLPPPRNRIEDDDDVNDDHDDNIFTTTTTTAHDQTTTQESRLLTKSLKVRTQSETFWVSSFEHESRFATWGVLFRVPKREKIKP